MSYKLMKESILNYLLFTYFKLLCIESIGKTNFNKIKADLNKKEYHNLLHSFRVYKLGDLSDKNNAISSLLHDVENKSVIFDIFKNSNLKFIDKEFCWSLISASYDHCRIVPIASADFQARDLLAYLTIPSNEIKIRKEFSHISDSQFYLARLNILERIQRTLDKPDNHIVKSLIGTKNEDLIPILTTGFGPEIDRIREKIQQN